MINTEIDRGFKQFMFMTFIGLIFLQYNILKKDVSGYGASFFMKGGSDMFTDKNKHVGDHCQSKEGHYKPVILCRSWMGIPKHGERATLVLKDGSVVSTSPVMFLLLGGQTYIETRSTIYVDEDHYNNFMRDEIYLYEGDTATVNCTTLPYNSAIEGTDLRYQNAIQGNWIEVQNSTIATASMTTTPSTQFTITAKKAGDTTITVKPAASVIDNTSAMNGIITGSAGGSYKELKVYVRKKPTLKLSTKTTNMAFNKTIFNAITAEVSNNSNNSLLYKWSSSKSSVINVAGSNNLATLISYDKEGSVTIACELTDDVHMYNPSVSAIKKSIKIQVSDYKLDLSGTGITNGGNISMNENQNTLTFKVNEADGVSQEWTSSDTKVATVEFVDGNVTIKKVGVGIATINCVSSTGNTISFNIISKAAKPSKRKICQDLRE